MKGRQLLALLGIVAISLVLAFPLREAVYHLVVVPLAYVGWLLQLLYLSLSQGVWWLLVIVIVLLVIGTSLIPELDFRRKVTHYQAPERGNVEALTTSLRKREKGVYFRWLVANRLGKLAFEILQQQEQGKPRSPFAPLTAPGWEAAPAVQEYLEKGLRGSFAEYPSRGWPGLTPLEKTPLDHDVDEVVAFLESKLEDRSTHGA